VALELVLVLMRALERALELLRVRELAVAAPSYAAWVAVPLAILTARSPALALVQALAYVPAQAQLLDLGQTLARALARLMTQSPQRNSTG